jgi:hypothetical protein
MRLKQFVSSIVNEAVEVGGFFTAANAVSKLKLMLG